MNLPDATFWHNKRVLITGHTGFKGTWLTLWLNQLGAKVTGISLAPSSDTRLFNQVQGEQLCESIICDIRDADKLQQEISHSDPEIVIHLAAQALVRESYEAPKTTYATNVMGTVNVLDALRGCHTTRIALMITTDKVYANQEWCWPYRESDRLGGHDPYSASKAASELVINSYRDAFFINQDIKLISARAGNVIGGGDWAKDRLIPDIIKAWQQGETVTIRSPKAVRPWQHVLEPLSAYLLIVERAWQGDKLSNSYNIGPINGESASVGHVLAKAQKYFPQGRIQYVNATDKLHEANLLTLDTHLIKQHLGISPRWDIEQAIQHTMEWYQKLSQGEAAIDLCLNDLRAFQEIV
ncbi:CDP-glucose 4,6-dehydratase [Motilimonas cestriensis]|uniref:CDP-glucose 4,6-dehydratase n=2 Tax=Motilimonas cestriensis TaxID=2742685 RepID=A0ABS8WBU1_9GAMM|nr:CDP-glucose 4,6-dehydratase [Motilimonas cestriensis]